MNVSPFDRYGSCMDCTVTLIVRKVRQIYSQGLAHTARICNDARVLLL